MCASHAVMKGNLPLQGRYMFHISLRLRARCDIFNIFDSPTRVMQVTRSSPPNFGKTKTGCDRFFVPKLVDIAGKTLNRLNEYLVRFWEYYQSSPALQKTLCAI